MIMDVIAADAAATAAVEFKAAALRYAEMGLAVLPLQPGKKEPLYQLVPHAFKDATTDPEQIAAWWTEWPDANVGIAVPEGTLVLDVDPRHGGTQDALAELLGGSIPQTWVARTGGAEDGRHVWVQWPERLDLSKALLRPGIDVKMGGKGYVVAAPSIHPDTGTCYAWLDGQAPWDSRRPAFPQFLIQQALAAQSRADIGTRWDGAAPPALLDGPQAAETGQGWLRWAVQKVQQGGEGRHHTGLGLALQLRDALLSYDAAEPVMGQYQRQVADWGDHTYPETEALATLRGVYSRPPRDLAPGLPPSTPQPFSQPSAADGLDRDDPRREVEFTDTGNAQRLASQYVDQLRYVRGWGWVAYRAGAWRRDADNEAMRCAKECVGGLLREAAETTNDPVRRMRLIDHAKRSFAEPRLAAMLKLAQSEPELMARPEDFDRDDSLLNLPNGTVDLRTGRVRLHNPADLLSKQAAVLHDPAATAPRWEQFLLEVFEGDTSLVDYIQRALGYSCTGSTQEHAFHVCHGVGGNGKSTMLETVARLLGDYAKPLRAEALMQSSFVDGGRATPELMALVGARLVVAQESGREAKLDSAKVKAWTGGDQITGRELHKPEFSFQPQFKLWLSTNARPDIPDTSEGIWRRIRMVPFNARFQGKEDRKLPEALAAEGSGILNWLIDGALRWQRDGLDPVAAVQVATQAYHEQEDSYLEFFTDVLVKVDGGDAKARVPFTEAYQAFCHWNAVSGGTYLTNQAFRKLAADRGFPKQKVGGVQWLLGCRLLPPGDTTGSVPAGDAILL